MRGFVLGRDLWLIFYSSFLYLLAWPRLKISQNSLWHYNDAFTGAAGAGSVYPIS
jgi:hypothetical protein